MLSRVADNLFWMSRHLERAEHTARLLDVNLHAVLDGPPQLAQRRWDRLLASLRTSLPPQQSPNASSIMQALAFDATNPLSIVSCIGTARDNARQAWEQINSEMWEQINRLFLSVSGAGMDKIRQREPHAFFATVKEGVHLFQGITDTTMSHGEGWQFIQVGRSIERAGATASLIDAHFASGDIWQDDEPLAYLEWIGLLKSCTAFEAYVKYNSASVEPDKIAAFLLLNADFPRSVRFLSTHIRSGLQAIGRDARGRGAGRAERLAGRMQASLDYGQITEIMDDDLSTFLWAIREQCDQISTAIYGTFIRYPIGTALTRQSGTR
ncbi:MAG: alpha-E domain-containing protein [Chloroflexota bacterium]